MHHIERILQKFLWISGILAPCHLPESIQRVFSRQKCNWYRECVPSNIFSSELQKGSMGKPSINYCVPHILGVGFHFGFWVIYFGDFLKQFERGVCRELLGLTTIGEYVPKRNSPSSSDLKSIAYLLNRRFSRSTPNRQLGRVLMSGIQSWIDIDVYCASLITSENGNLAEWASNRGWTRFYPLK